jgi:hypothetical protein
MIVHLREIPANESIWCNELVNKPTEHQRTTVESYFMFTVQVILMINIVTCNAKKTID